jgi:5-formyltetrahydrofolate cyclo-ligase
MLKSEARALFLTERKNISLEEKVLLDQAILLEFKKIDLTTIKCIHIYLPINSQNECNTYLISDFIRENYPKINMAIPKANFENGQMDAVFFNPETQLATNNLGIAEPINGAAIDPMVIDMIICPLLAFDLKGNRVGYGKGFYDRFLGQCKSDVIKLGLSYFEPINNLTDCNESDLPLSSCITPIQHYFFDR